MKLLALDTATEACSAALLTDGAWISRWQAMPRGHTSALMPMIHALLAEAELDLSALDGLAVGRGPGAFTGVRIGVAMAQGLALGADAPVAPVSNLAALAAQAAQTDADTKHVATVIDARANAVYAALYRIDADGVPVAVQAERVCEPDAIERFDGPVLAAGTGWDAYPDVLTAALGGPVTDSGVRLPNAQAIGTLGARMLAAGRGVAADQLAPVYLRDQVVG